MNNLNVNVMLLQEKSSSSSSDGLSFIDNDLEDEIILLVFEELVPSSKRSATYDVTSTIDASSKGADTFSI